MQMGLHCRIEVHRFTPWLWWARVFHEQGCSRRFWASSALVAESEALAWAVHELAGISGPFVTEGVRYATPDAPGRSYGYHLAVTRRCPDVDEVREVFGLGGPGAGFWEPPDPKILKPPGGG